MKEGHSIIRKWISWLDMNDKSRLHRFGFATLLVLVAFLLRQILSPVLRDALPFTFFITSSILASYFGGMASGSYALFCGWLLADYFFVPPIGSIGGYGKVQFISLIATLAPAMLAIVLIQFLHSARREARAELERRKRIERELVEAKSRVESWNAELEKRIAERTHELEQSVKFLEKFCYSIAHDLRAPLRAMHGFALALEEDYTRQLDETAKEFGTRIVKASQRMDKLILDLLDYGRLSHTRTQFDDVSVEEVLGNVLSRLRPAIDSNHAIVTIQRPLPHVRADKAMLNVILFHLIDNALKFTRPNEPARVEIACEENGDLVKLFIKDNGLGIAPAYQQKIFGLFETLRPAPGTATGVGLALVSKAVERMKGRIGLESERDKGSVFWIELPAATAVHRAPQLLEPAWHR